MNPSNTIRVVVILLLLGSSSIPMPGQKVGSLQDFPHNDTMFRRISGTVVDEKFQTVAGVMVLAIWPGGHRNVTTDSQGAFAIDAPPVALTLNVHGRYIAANGITVAADSSAEDILLRISYEVPKAEETLVITATTIDPAIDRRNDTIFDNTLFLRDDQLFETLNSGINAGQHEGGGESLEFRRFGFNLDHGGINGGLKVLVDDVPQNQATQRHGQGYLGSLKSLSPELLEDVDIINGPSARSTATSPRLVSSTYD